MAGDLPSPLLPPLHVVTAAPCAQFPVDTPAAPRTSPGGPSSPPVNLVWCLRSAALVPVFAEPLRLEQVRREELARLAALAPRAASD